MKYTENSLHILTAKSYKGIGNAWIVKNLKGNESVETIVSLLNKKIKGEPTSIEEFERLKINFEKKLVEKFQNYCDGFVAIGDDDFPKYRGKVKAADQPVFLYYKGNIDLLKTENLNVTVIGLLNPEGDIEAREREMIKEFVRNNASIVSGLAIGCDSIAHDETLKLNGKTIAILPSPLDNILPARNKKLALQIVEQGGLLISEYGRDFKNVMELSSRYKERDRLQALFSDTIVLAASYAKNSAEIWNIHDKKLDSGARLAMQYAKNYEISRAVMYNASTDKDNPMFDLNRQLINEQRDIFIINQDNLTEIVDKVIYLAKNNKVQKSQKTLFD